MVSTALDNVLSAQLEISTKIGRRWSDLVASVASGGEPDPADVAAILEAAEKSPNDLRQEVSIFVRRRELRAAIATAGAGVATARAEIKAAIAAADDVLAAVQREHAAAVTPLVARLEVLVAIERAAMEARAELIRTCDPKIRRRMEATRSLLESLQREARAVAVLLTEARDLLRSVRIEPHRYGATEPARIEYRIQTHETNLKKLNASTAAATATLDAASQEMIDS
jgi:hypothetical protein